MKETFYFSHDYHARHDPKLIALQMQFGMEAVGIYWCIIEMLYEQDGYIPLTDKERITFELRTNIERITQVIESDLFTDDGVVFYSQSVLDRLNERRLKSDKAKESIKARWSKKHTNVLRPEVKRNTIKESKGKEMKVKESKEKENNTSLISDGVPPAFGNEEINKILQALKLKVKCSDFKEPVKMQRIHGKNLLNLMEKLGREEFVRRLDEILCDSFKQKNAGSLAYLYREIKGFVDKQPSGVGVFIS